MVGYILSGILLLILAALVCRRIWETRRLKRLSENMEDYLMGIGGNLPRSLREDTIAQVEILFRRHLAFHTLLHVVVRILFPHDRHAVGADNLQERLVFIAPGCGDDKRDVHIRLLRHAARQTVTGCAQTTQNMRRKLPTKH